MDLTTQLLYVLWTLVLANGHLSPGFGLPGQRDPGAPDILDPLHLNPRRGPFDHHPLGPGFGHHHRDHGMLEDILDPFGDSNERKVEIYNQNDNIRVTTDNTPLKVNLLPETHNNNTVNEKDINKKLEKKETTIPIGNNNIKSVKNVIQAVLPAKEEQILRTNGNKTVIPKPTDDTQVSKHNEIIPVKLNVTQGNTQSSDSIVFPDNVEEFKSKLKDVNNNMNKTCNPITNSNNLSVTDKVNMTKNRDGAFIPVQAVPVNPVQDMNGKFLLVPINPSGNIQNQALPITNDVFPNRSPVYTTIRPGQGPLYTSVANAVPLNIQSNGAWNNGNNNYYQNPGVGVSSNPNHNTAVNNPNGNNWNPNLGTFNPNLSNNLENNPPMNTGNVPSNSIGIPNTTFNPTIQQPNINQYNNQPNYNNQGNVYPARNLQDSGLNQQTNPSGLSPSYNTPNYNGQTYVPVNGGLSNNIQTNPNGQQFYIVPNNQQNNNINTGQPIILNTQGNAMNLNPNNGNNNQQYMIVNANQLNIPQNGQGNNIYTLQNGQLVALIPVQLSNGALVNNNNVVNPMTSANSNIVQPNTMLPNNGNPQPNVVTMNGNPNQPNLILMNGNTPNGALLLNGQTSNLNGQNSLPNGPIILNGQTSNLNGQNSLPNGPIILNGQTSNLNGQNSQPNGPVILNAQNVLANGQTPLVNNGRNLYTMVTVPNNYVNNVGGNPGYQVPSSSVNLMNTRDKVDKEDSGAAGNITGNAVNTH